jgi:tight adherence protein C
VASARLAAIAQRLQPGVTHEQLRRRLHMAGLHVSPQAFLAAKTLLGIAGLAFGVATSSSNPTKALMIAPALAVVLFIMPGCYLTLRQRSRRQRVELELPDALDLLTVSVEAGLGFDSAVRMVTQRMEGPLSDEFRVMLEEMRLGASRRQAMLNIGERTGSEEVSSFVRSLLQSDELGVPIGSALRVQADDMRTRRQLHAEEQATKAPVKLLFPTVLFIFPVIFMVIVAPAVMNVFDMLGTM